MYIYIYIYICTRIYIYTCVGKRNYDRSAQSRRMTAALRCRLVGARGVPP